MARGRSRVELIGEAELKAKIQQLGDAVIQANSAAVRAAEVPILTEANANAPGPHILALQSKKESNENLAVVNIGPDKDHWYYQFAETGATAHEIKAKNGKSLAFEGRNGLVITKSVKHPGRPAAPFLRPAMSHNRDAAQKLAGEIFRKGIERLCDGVD
jgi:HK97 gp10 family phage protein